jgi:hypothetical protein
MTLHFGKHTSRRHSAERKSLFRKTIPVFVSLTGRQVAALDLWRTSQSPDMSRAEAIRKLISNRVTGG